MTGTSAWLKKSSFFRGIERSLSDVSRKESYNTDATCQRGRPEGIPLASTFSRLSSVAVPSHFVGRFRTVGRVRISSNVLIYRVQHSIYRRIYRHAVIIGAWADICGDFRGN